MRYEFTWKAVGYGSNREEALADAEAYLDTAEPCDEELLKEDD